MVLFDSRRTETLWLARIEQNGSISFNEQKMSLWNSRNTKTKLTVQHYVRVKWMWTLLSISIQRAARQQHQSVIAPFLSLTQRNHMIRLLLLIKKQLPDRSCKLMQHFKWVHETQELVEMKYYIASIQMSNSFFVVNNLSGIHHIGITNAYLWVIDSGILAAGKFRLQ